MGGAGQRRVERVETVGRGAKDGGKGGDVLPDGHTEGNLNTHHGLSKYRPVENYAGVSLRAGPGRAGRRPVWTPATCCACAGLRCNAGRAAGVVGWSLVVTRKYDDDSQINMMG